MIRGKGGCLRRTTTVITMIRVHGNTHLLISRNDRHVFYLIEARLKEMIPRRGALIGDHYNPTLDEIPVKKPS